MSSAPDASAVLGCTEPRLWTPPLRELTPYTSVGFDRIEFARDVLHRPFDPWQEWLNIHAGELLPDGRPRFRIVLVLAARQNGKTEMPVILSLYWQFIEVASLILGTSTKLNYAQESWKKARKLADKVAQRNDAEGKRIRELIGRTRWYRETNGEQESWTVEDSRYKIAASNEEGGRSLTIDRLVCDELRQHHDYSAWDACEPAASPRDAQIWAMSNAGDDNSVVLNDLRDDAIEFIKWWGENGNEGIAELLLSGGYPEGMPDFRLGLFEWSAPEDADPTDIHALAQANPNLNRRNNDGPTLLAKARRAVARGGKALTGFQTENMCIKVKLLDPAIDPGKWRDCFSPGDLSGARSRVALVFDVAPDELHATLLAAAVLADGRTRIEAVSAWTGPDCMGRLRTDLPGHLAQIKPQALGWLPVGPAAALAADMRKRPGWPPAGVTVAEIRGEVPAICMGLAEQVRAGRVAHSNDPLINDHVLGAERLYRGDVWVFSRKGEGHVDAAYAAAGAVHLARTLPPPIGKPRLVTAPD